MQEQFYIYSLNILLILSAYKGFKQGLTYEALSIFFFLLSCAFAILFYNHTLARKVLSILTFFFIYFLGKFICFLKKTNNKFENQIGAFLGVIRFFLYLITLNVIANLLNTSPLSFKENFYTKKLNPITSKITEKLKNHFKEK